MIPSGTSSKNDSGNGDGNRIRSYRVRCGQCEACSRQDCRVCDECVRKKKYGGDGSSKRACLQRKCQNLKFLPKSPSPISVCCGNISKKRKVNQQSKSPSSQGKDDTEDTITPQSLKVRHQPSRAQSSSSSSNSFGIFPQAIATATVENQPKRKCWNQLPASLIQLPEDNEDLFGVGEVQSSSRDTERPRPVPSPPTYFAGQPVGFKQYGVCSVCGMGEEVKNDTIVLCDGHGCNQEFHMQCCRPPLTRIPEGDFFCFDCSDDGATANLKDYLDQVEDERDLHNQSVDQLNGQPPLTFVDDLILKDIKDHQSKIIEDMKQKANTAEKTTCIVDIVRPPRSELDMMHRDADSLVGKAIRLYCPTTNDYHTGRILQCNPMKGRPELPCSEGSAVDTECLVHFPAGTDNRKSKLSRWIFLEEHSLAIASDVGWGAFTTVGVGNEPSKKEWLPSKLWLRSSRELVMSMHVLVENLDQIRYRTWRRFKGPGLEQCDDRKAPTWILGEILGKGSYQLLHLAKETRKTPLYTGRISSGMGQRSNTVWSKMAMDAGDSTRVDSLENNGTSTREARTNMIMWALERAEIEEQDRVRMWNAIPLISGNHPKALTCRDESLLEPLGCSVHESLVRPSLLIRRGLDRIQIWDQVSEIWEDESRQNRDEHVDFRTKDVALSLSCSLVDSEEMTACIQHRNALDRLAGKFHRTSNDTSR